MSRIRTDIDGGDRSRVDGTPSFYINGTKLAGSWDEAPLLRALESALGSHR